ncbi:MAG: DUF4350 domain-containing protein [Chitinophagaceae bacterium]|nr:DUF4350 domain-containing protein [Chitinophagaceae bacterium]
MKRYTPYILIFFVVSAFIILLATGVTTPKKKLDERITLRHADKKPYGTYVAYNLLKSTFPGAEVFTSKYEPGYWENASDKDKDQLLMIITDKFDVDRFEMNNLIEFAENGNDVFISTVYMSSYADEVFRCNSSSGDLNYIAPTDLKKNYRFYLKNPPFDHRRVFTYPGRTFSSFFSETDSATTDILGNDASERVNFIRLQTGKGQIFLHLEPLSFSNYFLLNKDNAEFYSNVMSLIRPGIRKVIWDEYYLNKRAANNKRKKGWMSVLMQYPAFRAALITAIITLILFVLFEMRRKQRIIPVMTKPANDSLDFVKTIGRLYYEKGDHKNLCKKMAAYFSEHVRNKYKLPTTKLDAEFIKNLHYKSGVPETEIEGITDFISYLDGATAISQSQLKDFYKQLESFYKKA